MVAAVLDLDEGAHRRRRSLGGEEAQIFPLSRRNALPLPRPPSPAPASGQSVQSPRALQTDGQLGPSAAVQFVAVGKDGIDRLHPGPALRREGDSAAGGDDPGAGMAAAQAAQGLAGLALGLGGDSAAVDDEEGEGKGAQMAGDDSTLPRIEAAAEGDDLSLARPALAGAPARDRARLPCSSGGGRRGGRGRWARCGGTRTGHERPRQESNVRPQRGAGAGSGETSCYSAKVRRAGLRGLRRAQPLSPELGGRQQGPPPKHGPRGHPASGPSAS